MLNRTRITLIAAVVLLVPNFTYAASRSSFQDSMRRLWSDHVAYTRLFIVAAAAGSPELDATTQRLLQNQADIGDAVGEFYGRDAGNELTALLTDHILIAASIVNAAKAGDTATVNSEIIRWRENATDIARFLHAANPKNWPEATLESALFMHLDQTLSEATNHLQGNYVASIRDYDRAMDHMLTVADILTKGLIAQFPAKFSSAGGSR